jgi:hypothetical protein
VTTVAKAKGKRASTALALVDRAARSVDRKSKSEAEERANVMEGLRLLIRAADLLIERVNAGEAKAGRPVARRAKRAGKPRLLDRIRELRRTGVPLADAVRQAKGEGFVR